jgi:predicted GNAT family acetyltransferase
VSATGHHVLDHPIWSALTTRQAALAERNARARRFPTDVAPFADMIDMSPESFAALRDLMQPDDTQVLFTPEPMRVPADFDVLRAEEAVVMTGTPSIASNPAADIVTLGTPDIPAMAELVALTNPGPFAARTHTLGTFLGIRIDGQLVAMIGERMKPGDYTEMTGICVHPNFRGRGLAQVLMGEIGRQIVARGEIPFLHVYAGNMPAIGLYRRQGMAIHRTMHVTIVRRP